MHKDHPVDRLVVTAGPAAPASVAGSMRALHRQLAGRRDWILGPPALFDESDAHRDRRPGLVLSIFTARPPWNQELNRAIDRAHLDEVKELIGEICRISADHGASFSVDFAGESIGSIEDGRMDESLEAGLIAEWERVLDEQER